ncbi:MAG: NAD(+) synthase [Ruminococcus sp.]|nr:NAD(+) synthase [Ruminococcus sp.]
MNYSFNAKETTEKAAQWIRDFFEKNGKGCNAVIGISGGKDSSICAALCVEALGKDRVIGVLMPNGEQSDIDMARLLVEHLGIKAVEVNINEAYKGVLSGLENSKPINGFSLDGLSNQTIVNLPPRLRMAVLYAVSQSCNGRVANTCNLSEDWVGYSTRYGDSAGDFSPLARLTVAEVKEMGRVLGLPEVLVDKVPSDGLCGKTDEDNLGFTYAVLDRYIRTGVCENSETKALIDDKHIKNKFKLELMPCFEFQP